MAGRIRSIKPEWLENERLARCSCDARLLSVALICLADDHGNGRGSVEYLRAQVWAYPRDPRETLLKAQERVREALSELENAGYVVIYQSEGQSFFHLPGWNRHQKVNHVGNPRVPTPSQESLESARDSLSDFLDPLTRVTSNEKGEGRKKKRASCLPSDWIPDAKAAAFAAEVGKSLEHELASFRDHYAANGKQFVDWNATLRNWLRREFEGRPAKRKRHGRDPSLDLLDKLNAERA